MAFNFRVQGTTDLLAVIFDFLASRTKPGKLQVNCGKTEPVDVIFYPELCCTVCTDTHTHTLSETDPTYRTK